MSNFSSAPNRHGPSAGQMAVAAGLIQQRQQVGLSRQQVGLQKKSLDAQNQANSLAAAQLSEMQKIEENRKREKLLDVWSATYQNLMSAATGTASNEWLTGKFLFIDS